MALITRNTLLYGDNLPLLREYIDGGSVDLVYLDPSFNSNRSYNVLFKDESGQESEARIVELLVGSTVRMPAEHGTFKQAEKAQKQPGVQKPLL